MPEVTRNSRSIDAPRKNIAATSTLPDTELQTQSVSYEKGSAKVNPNKGANPSYTSHEFYHSIFNNFNVVSFNSGNWPITDEELGKGTSKGAKNALFAQTATAITLCETPEGGRIYSPKDFLLCARYGLPINRMITLRRFPVPVGDNILDIIKGSANDTHPGRGVGEPDVARLITYMDDNINKISDVCKLGWKLNWRDLQAQAENVSLSSASGQQDSKFGIGGFMKNIVPYMDGTVSNQAVQGDPRLNYNPLSDNNKVHGPVDSIAKTTTRDIGLENSISFNITFDYELRSINGINQKMMFIDLIANILACTMNDGRFWGGSRIWTGERPSAWMRKLQFMNPKNAEDFFGQARVKFHEVMKGFATVEDAKKTALNIVKNIAVNGLNLALGSLLDKVGRPSIMMMNSLLRGDYTGEWHLTIGNPLNPIISIGNLVLENTEIEFGDQLGFDDFPTTIKVTCTLRPGQPRDRANLEAIFNNGQGRLYWPPKTILRTKKSTGSSGLGIQTNGDITGDSFGGFDQKAILDAADYATTYNHETGDEIDPDMTVTSSQVASMPDTSQPVSVNSFGEESSALDDTTSKYKSKMSSLL